MIAISDSLLITTELLRSGQCDLEEYITVVCERLEALDSQIQAFLPEPNRHIRILAEIATLKQKFPNPRVRPLLWGVPIGVKDVFSIEELPTRAGSQLPPELFTRPQADFITTLRQAGAIILGKTHMDEFAYCEPPPTRNPHNLNHTPGGSSGGSAAAVAAKICSLAIGTQTTRSIIGPAAFCGIVGLKPTYGRIPTDGIINMSPSMDTVGFFTNDVASLRLASVVLIKDWKLRHQTKPTKKPILGVPQGILQTYVLEDGREGYQEQLAQLKEAGYQLKYIPFFEANYIEDIFSKAGDLLHGEMAQIHENWFSQYEALYRPRTANAIRRGQKVTIDSLIESRKASLLLRKQIETLMHEQQIDLWVTPASGGAAPKGYDVTGWGGQTLIWSFAGLPCITIPAGRAANQLPLGLQFVAGFNQDEMLVEQVETIATILKNSNRF